MKKEEICILDEVVQKANRGLEGSVKHIWQGISETAKHTVEGGGEVRVLEHSQVWAVH